MTSLNFQFGARAFRVVVDSSRAAKILRRSLETNIVTEEADLAFILTAPAGLRRNHQLVDRAGITVSNGRGLNSGLHALATHLSAAVDPSDKVVRVGARALYGDHGAVVCLAPLLHLPLPDRNELAALGYRLANRFSIDLDVESGKLIEPPIPWPELRKLGNANGQLEPVSVSALLVAGAPEAPPSRAEVAAQLTSQVTFGSTRDALAAMATLARTTPLFATGPANLIDVLSHLKSGYEG